MTAGRGRADDRHRGREAALQLLYQWEVGHIASADVDDAIHLFWETHPAPEPRQLFATTLAKGTMARLDVVDPLIEQSAEHWRLSRMAVVDRMILRLAVYEFLFTDTPHAVVIDEALELAKTFSGDEAVGFINGVLDAIRRKVEERR